MIEAVLAGAEATAPGEPKEVKGVAAAEDAAGLKQGGDVRSSAAGGDVDEGLG